MTRSSITAARRRTARLVAMLVSAAVVVAAAPVQGLATTGPPTLTVRRLIQTTPFVDSSWSMQDSEGSAYVPRDRALWLVDDLGRRIFVVDPRTGVLKRTIGSRVLRSARRFGGVDRAGPARARDMEAVAYDAARDRLYVFSGDDCWPSARRCLRQGRPAVFRFDRRNGRLRLHSFQPLPARSDATAAAWNPADGWLYASGGRAIRPYSYKQNRYGDAIQVAGLRRVLGMDFTRSGSALMVTHSRDRLSRVDWASRSLAGGWTVDLSPFRVRDARAVAVIGGRFFVSDGADGRPSSSRYRYSVFVLGVAR